MLNLRLVGIHDDGESLVLEAQDGTSYRLPIDQNLRTSITKARRAQPARALGSNGAFGPRDIQIRFRQGASVEEIVAESGWDANRVRRYEWPILAERSNIIQSAQNVVISAATAGRRSADHTARPLREHIAHVAKNYKISPDDAQWTTWQQESGQWTVSVDFDFPSEVRESLPRNAEFPARWTYNPANQSIYASNEAAYFLMGRDNTGDAPLPGIGAHDDKDAPVQVDEPKISEVRVPNNPAHNELLDELAARRGTPNANTVARPQKEDSQNQKPTSAFFSSTSPKRGTPNERKLAELLERARHSSTRTAPAQAEPAPHHEIQPVPVSPAQVASPSVAEKTTTSTNDEEHGPQESAQKEEQSFDIEPVELESTNASTDDFHASDDNATQVSTEETHSSEHSDSSSDEENSGQNTNTQNSLDDSVTESFTSTSTAETAPADLPANTENSGSADSVSDASQKSVEETKKDVDLVNKSAKEEAEPKTSTRSNRSKRTSVPSWDDIIFGNQRR